MYCFNLLEILQSSMLAKIGASVSNPTLVVSMQFSLAVGHVRHAESTLIILIIIFFHNLEY